MEAGAWNQGPSAEEGSPTVFPRLWGQCHPLKSLPTTFHTRILLAVQLQSGNWNEAALAVPAQNENQLVSVTQEGQG